MSFRPGLDAFGGSFSPAPSYTPAAASFRPHLEQLDERVVPAVNHWVGSVSIYASVAANWSLNHLPQAGEDIWFVPTLVPGGVPMSVACYGLAAPSGGGEYNSVFFDNGYTATVTLAQGFDTKALVVLNGTLDQPYYSSENTDITVTGGPTIDGNNSGILSGRPDFHWTGGTINSTSHVANLVIDNATARLEAANGGTLTSGSTLLFEEASEGVLGDSSLAFLNSATITVSNSVFTAAAASQPRVVTGLTKIQILDGGTWQVHESNRTFDQGLDIVEGTFELKYGAMARFKGFAGPQGNQGSVVLRSGTILIENDSGLTADEGVILLSGSLVTTDHGLPIDGQITRRVKITGNLKNSGADIVINDPARNRPGVEGHYFLPGGAGLEIEGNVTWTGGVYRPYINAALIGGTVESTQADLWKATGTFTVSGGQNGAKIGHIVLNTPAGGTGAIRSGREWLILKADGGISIMAGSSAPGFETGGFTLSPAAPANEWYLKKT